VLGDLGLERRRELHQAGDARSVEMRLRGIERAPRAGAVSPAHPETEGGAARGSNPHRMAAASRAAKCFQTLP
jgi:hypothetical protein